MTTASPATREAWGVIAQIFRADKSRRFGVINDIGLTMTQGMMLLSLDPDEPKAMSEVAGQMHCDNSNITGVADRLTALGLIERRPADHDRRVKTLVLTSKGKRLRSKLHDRMGEPPACFSALSDTEAEQLVVLLNKVADAQV